MKEGEPVHEPTPTVGRSVHFRARAEMLEEVCRAAFITEVDEDGTGKVGLAVLGPEELTFHAGVDHGEKAGTWHWPERASATTVSP